MKGKIWYPALRAVIVAFLLMAAIYSYFLHYNVAACKYLLLLIPFFLALINMLFIIRLVRIYELPHNVFFRKYLLSSGIKFLINLLLLLLLIFLNRSNPKPFIVVYLLSYFVFFILEIVELKILIKKSKDQ